MEGQKRRGSALMLWLVACGALLLLPVAYVLSYGPAIALASRYDSMQTFKAIYAPLIWLMYEWEPFHDFLNWYCEFWP